jgi:hypothetical protein
MQTTVKPSSTTMTAIILRKIKKLETGKVYSYAALGKIGSKERVVLSRFADTGVIIKYGRGKFFKPLRSIYKRSDIYLPLNKAMFTFDQFWSVGDGAEVKADLLIAKYIVSNKLKDISALYNLFGYTRVLESALKAFGGRGAEQYKQVREHLETCAKWSVENDK